MSSLQISTTERALHWVVGIGMIAALSVGLYMVRAEDYAMYGTHKSVGMILFLFILWRAVLRLSKGWPETISTGARWEHGLARVIHWVLILGTLIMPISGMIMSYYGGHGLSVFGLEIAGPNIGAEGRPVAVNADLSGTGAVLHGLIGRVLIAAILLHVAGALKHHFIDRDSTLRRMVGRS